MAQTCTPSYDKRLKMKFGSICNLRGLLVIMEMIREREKEMGFKENTKLTTHHAPSLLVPWINIQQCLTTFIYHPTKLLAFNNYLFYRLRLL
jgi:hypothetical protein